MSAPPNKKQKYTSVEFRESWTEKYGMIMNKKDNKALCILCSQSIVCRNFTVKRHYETVHKQLSQKSEEEQKAYIFREISKRNIQSEGLTKFLSTGSNLVAASFEISKVIAQHGKPLSDGEYIKKAWLESSNFLFENISEKNKIIQSIKDLPLSRNTVKDRIIKLENNTSEQLSKDLMSCKYFSICLDESTDITSSARLAIFARFCMDDKICEELINIVTLPERTTGADICEAVINELYNRQVKVSKVVSVTTDGAPSMIGKEAGFVNRFKIHVGHPLIGFHCIIHQEALCAKSGLKELEDVMETVTKVVNFISARALKKRQFQILLDEVHSVYNGLLMYNHVRWLSRGSVLIRFVECFEEIHLFLTDKKFDCKDLSDSAWIYKLMFFADFCSHLNILNVKLQGSGKTLDVMFDNIKAFEIKLSVFKCDVDSQHFKYFPNLKKYICDLKTDEKTDCQNAQILCMQVINSTIEQFSSRFANFRELEETTKFIKFPDSVKLAEINLNMFQWIDLDDFEMQLIDFQSSSIWKQKFIDLRGDLENIERERLMKGLANKTAENEVLKVWNSIPETFACLKNLAISLLTIFSSTYSCESLFSVMNFVKSIHRSRLTDETSAACIKLKVTNYKPDINYLSSMMQQQKSH